MIDIRKIREDDLLDILEIVNDAAMAYKGIIPDDVWSEPYMPQDELAHDIKAGVEFWCANDGQGMIGVMGIQEVLDTTLIRHAYVRKTGQRSGVGGTLLERLLEMTSTSVLVGTWADAWWAIRFYEKHGFTLQDMDKSQMLLEKYWNITKRQSERSVVLQLIKPDINTSD